MTFIKINLSNGLELNLTIEQAKELYDELSKLTELGVDDDYDEYFPKHFPVYTDPYWSPYLKPKPYEPVSPDFFCRFNYYDY